jgi:hypothetical protein
MNVAAANVHKKHSEEGPINRRVNVGMGAANGQKKV